MDINLWSEQVSRGENSHPFSVLANQLLTTADRTSTKFLNRYNRGIIFVITTANEAGSASITPKILTYDASGNAITLASFTAITADATSILCYYPAALTGFSGTQALVGQLPRHWALLLDYTGTPASDKIDTKVDAFYLA